MVQTVYTYTRNRTITGTLMNAGHPATNFVVTGNVLHYDSLLANLLDPICNPGWIAKKYKAIEKFSDRPELWQQWSSIFRRSVQVDEADSTTVSGAMSWQNTITLGMLSAAEHLSALLEREKGTLRVTELQIQLHLARREYGSLERTLKAAAKAGLFDAQRTAESF